MSKTRFQFELSESRVSELERLMDTCGIETKKDLFNNALTILEWAVEEVTNGNKIASVNPQEDVYQPLQMPILREAAAKHRQPAQKAAAAAQG